MTLLRRLTPILIAALSFLGLVLLFTRPRSGLSFDPFDQFPVFSGDEPPDRANDGFDAADFHWQGEINPANSAPNPSAATRSSDAICDNF